MTANRVLRVEDDVDTSDMLKITLGLSDFEAVVASDIDDALRLMGRGRFSLYVLDGGSRSSEDTVRFAYLPAAGGTIGVVRLRDYAVFQ